MATLGILTDTIARRLKDPSSTAVSRQDIQIAINDAINFYKNEVFWFNEREVSIDFDDDNNPGTLTNVLQVPENTLYILQASGVVIVYNGTHYPVIKVSQNAYDWYAYDTTDRPQFYTEFYNNRLVYPFPNENYTATVRFVTDYTPFATNGDDDATSNDFTEYAEALIRNDALSRLHADLRQDETMSASFARAAQIELANLRQRTNNKNATGILAIENPLYNDYYW